MSLMVVYRHIDYDYDCHRGGFVCDVATAGAGLGLGFRW